MTDASARGSFLDVVVLMRFICLSKDNPVALSAFFTDLDTMCNGYTFQVKRIVSGCGMLSQWMAMIVSTPDDEIVPGLRASGATRDQCRS
jgi:hypothetical protein